MPTVLQTAVHLLSFLLHPPHIVPHTAPLSRVTEELLPESAGDSEQGEVLSGGRHTHAQDGDGKASQRHPPTCW